MCVNVDILMFIVMLILCMLNMVMSGMCDLLIIVMLFVCCLVVKIFVCEYDSLVVWEVILCEILCGGQVYYFYNDVENIQKVVEWLVELVFEVWIVIGYGQMCECELEWVMNDFYY